MIVLIGDDATLLCDGGEQREQVIPARYHELKALAHLAFGVQLTLMANGSGRVSEVTASELHEKRAQIQEVQAAANPSSPCASLPTMKAFGVNGRVFRSHVIRMLARYRPRPRPKLAFEELIIPDEIHDLLRWSDWIRAYRATAEFFDRRLSASGERQ